MAEVSTGAAVAVTSKRVSPFNCEGSFNKNRLQLLLVLAGLDLALMQKRAGSS